MSDLWEQIDDIVNRCHSSIKDILDEAKKHPLEPLLIMGKNEFADAVSSVVKTLEDEDVPLEVYAEMTLLLRTIDDAYAILDDLHVCQKRNEFDEQS